jgi:hypothetical protein
VSFLTAADKNALRQRLFSTEPVKRSNEDIKSGHAVPTMA